MCLNGLNILDTGPAHQLAVLGLYGSGRVDCAARADVQRVVNLFTRAGEKSQGKRRMFQTVRAFVVVPLGRYWAGLGLTLGYLRAGLGSGSGLGYASALDLGRDWAGFVVGAFE
jgi:L-aminopeptidase/D-esterase-like protein